MHAPQTCEPQELWENILSFDRHSRKFDLYVPKHHLMLHLTWNVRWSGSPQAHAVWGDESDNKLMKQVLRNVSSACFESLGLSKLQALLDRRYGGVKRPRS